jgi:sugar phosphate permease
MFIVTGIGGLLWLIPWRLLAVEADSIGTVQDRTAAEPLMKFLRMPLMWGIMIGTFSYNYFQYFCLTWLPAYFVERRGLDLKSMGWYSMFSFGGMAIVATAAGWWADRLISAGADPAVIRLRFTLAGLAVASTELIGAYAQSDAVALAFAVISLSGLGLATANYWALTQTLLPGSSIGRVAGLQNFASNLSGIIAPVLTGWLIERTGSYDAPMLAVALVLTAGFFAYLILVKRPQPAT